MIFLDANRKEYTLPKNEKIHWRISVYSLVLSKDNKLLVNIPTWNTLYELPGGGVEPHEAIAEGMIRECYEETGYRIKSVSNMPFYMAESNFYHRTLKRFYRSVNLVYRAKLVSQKQYKEGINSSENPNEIAQVEWVPLSRLNKKNCHHIVYPAIKLLQKLV